MLTPVMTDIAAAPESLLKFVRCKCKVSTKNPCGANICSCHKNGLKCVTACGDFRGESCQNAEEISFSSENKEFDQDHILVYSLSVSKVNFQTQLIFFTKVDFGGLLSMLFCEKLHFF